jgi:hypothetical protein
VRRVGAEDDQQYRLRIFAYCGYKEIDHAPDR